MAEVSIRELRNHGGEVIARVSTGERVTVTHSGKPVAELRPLGRAPVALDELIRRRSRLPLVDVDALRRDVDDVLDGTV